MRGAPDPLRAAPPLESFADESRRQPAIGLGAHDRGKCVSAREFARAGFGISFGCGFDSAARG